MKPSTRSFFVALARGLADALEKQSAEPAAPPEDVKAKGKPLLHLGDWVSNGKLGRDYREGEAFVIDYDRQLVTLRTAAGEELTLPVREIERPLCLLCRARPLSVGEAKHCNECEQVEEVTTGTETAAKTGRET